MKTLVVNRVEFLKMFSASSRGQSFIVTKVIYKSVSKIKFTQVKSKQLIYIRNSEVFSVNREISEGIAEGLELERSYTTWKNSSDQVFRHTKDFIQGCSQIRRAHV